MDELNLFIYGEIGGDPLFGQAAPTPEEIQKEISAHPAAKTLVVHISSPGGGVFDGWTIGNILKNSGKNTICKIEGLSASIATYIALSCDRVEMAETARFMIHNPKIDTGGAEESELKDAAEQMSKIKDDLINIYKQKTGLSVKQLSDMMDQETWLNADEAKEQGFIDGFMEPIKAVAKFDIKHSKMEKTKKVDLSILDKIIAKAEKLLTPKDPNNISVMLADGSTVWVDSEDGEFEGKNVYTVDENGEPTDMPVEDGTYALDDGRSLTVEGGVVSSVQEAEPTETDLLKDQVAKLEKEIADNKAEKEEVEKKNEETNKTVSELILEVENLKKMTAGDNKPLKKPVNQPVNKFDKQTEEVHPLDAFAAGLKRNK